MTSIKLVVQIALYEVKRKLLYVVEKYLKGHSMKDCAAMDSQTIYKDDNYEITNYIFVYGDIIYSLKHLTSIKLEKTEKKFPFAILTLSLLLILIGGLLNFEYAYALAILGVLGVIGSFLAYFISKPVHKLNLVFSSGEKELLEDVDYDNLLVVADSFKLAITSGVRKYKLKVF